jgi:hypothetical protein
LFSMHSASSSSCLSLVSWPGKKQLAAWSIALSLYLKLSSAKHHRKSFLGSATLNHHSLALFPWCFRVGGLTFRRTCCSLAEWILTCLRSELGSV